MLSVHFPVIGCLGLQCIVNYNVIRGHFGRGEHQEILVISMGIPLTSLAEFPSLCKVDSSRGFLLAVFKTIG